MPRFGWAGEDYGTAYVGTIVTTRIRADAPARALTEYGNLLRVELGRGALLVDNLLWDAAWRELSFRAPRVPSILATNMGVRVAGGPNQKPLNVEKLEFRALDLGEYYNIPLSDVLADAPRKLAGVPFDIRPGKLGAIMLGSPRLDSAAVKTKLPEKVTGIRVNGEADHLFFLQTAWDVYESGPGWGTGEAYGGYRINYVDGSNEYAPLQGFIHAAIPCDYHGDLPGASLAWPEREPDEDRAPKTIFGVWLDTYVRLEGRWIQREHTNRLYVMRWTNPHPEKMIASIDFLGANAFVQPILLGITAGH